MDEMISVHRDPNWLEPWERPRLPYVCRCGQLSGDERVCDSCRDLEREPQGETVRLFQPAPAQIPGQASMDLLG